MLILVDLFKTKYNTDKLDFEKKNSNADKKIPNTGELVKETDHNAKFTEIKSYI